MTYEIEKGVPIPANVKRGVKHANSGRKREYPFHAMDVSDSIFVSGDEHKIKSAKMCAYREGALHGKAFVMHEQDGGVRIWRAE